MKSLTEKWIQFARADLEAAEVQFSPQFSFTYNKKNAEDIFNKTKRLFIWLEKRLTQEK